MRRRPDLLFSLALLSAWAIASSLAGNQPASASQTAPVAQAGQAAASSQGTQDAEDSTATPQNVPRVRLVATGGTISNKRGGRLTAEELVGTLPELARYAKVEYEQFANVASSSITLAQWLDLSRRLNTLFRDEPDLAGLVVTSGTDTLEELAWFLHLTVRDERPVVITGAMRNPSMVAPDGPANLLAAFRVAASPDAIGRGALVVLNDEINSARDVTKSDALRLDTFISRPGGTLGVVDSDRVVFRRRIDARHSAQSEFDVFAFDNLPRVDVLMVYQGAPGDLIKAAVNLGAQGLVLATAGAGATSGTQGEGIALAIERGLPVVTTTRTGAGRIAARRGGRPQATSNGPGIRVAGEDHTAIKARVLLMLSLAAGLKGDDLQRVFLEY